VCLSTFSDGEGYTPTNLLPTSTPIPTAIIDQFSKLRIAKAFSIFSQSLDITAKLLADLRLAADLPDVIVRPDVAKYGLFDYVDPADLITKGIDAVDSSSVAISNSFSWIPSLNRFQKKPTIPSRMLL
jgi:NTE family protein